MSELNVGWFGKLPGSPEFLKWNGGGEVVQELDQVFSRAIYHLKMSGLKMWKSRFMESMPIEFLFQTKGSRERLVGLACPSQDQVGRVYPFLFFVRGWKPPQPMSLIREPIRWFPWFVHVKSYMHQGKQWRREPELYLDHLNTVGREPLNLIRSDREIDEVYQNWLKGCPDPRGLLGQSHLPPQGASQSEERNPSEGMNDYSDRAGRNMELPVANYGENCDIRLILESMIQALTVRNEWAGIFWRRGWHGQAGQFVFVREGFLDSQLMELILPKPECEQKGGWLPNVNAQGWNLGDWKIPFPGYFLNVLRLKNRLTWVDAS